ncbi:MAG: hypothetical protein C4323_07460 [Mastigocladus sp. ERB_26_2]
MKFHLIFKTYLDCSNYAEVFLYLKDTFTDSITLWHYFVNWQKVLKIFREIEIHLNTLNYLIGKDDIENEFCNLLRQYPNLICVVPILIACKTANFKILTDYTNGNLIYKIFNFKSKNFLDEEEINRILEFTQ